MEYLYAYYLIESGRPLELIQQHLSERRRVGEANKAIADELGIKEGRTSLWPPCGVLTAVVFPGSVPEGWTKPDKKGASRPKHGTEWSKRLAAQEGWEEPSVVICRELDVPLTLDYAEGNGFSHIGSPFTPCGFLWASPEGPFGLYIPDISAEVERFEKERGEVVTKPDRNWQPTMPGLRRIEKEEWTILANQKVLELRRAEREAAAATCAGDPA